MKRNSIVILTLLLLSSCSLYRSFKSPEVSNKNLFGEGVEMQDTLIQLPSWKDIFVDQSLQTLIEKGLKSNSDLQIALLNIEQAEASLLSAKLRYLPSFALSPEASVSRTQGVSGQTYNLPLVAQWEIDLFGKIRNSKQQARAYLLRSEEYVKLVQTQLIASIANSYFTLVMLDEQMKLTKISIINQEQNLMAITEMKAAGMQNEAAVNQATANLFSVQASAKDLEMQIRQVENAIALLVNEPPHAIVRQSKDATALSNVSLAQNISLQALAHRPDVRVAEHDLRSSFYGVNIARSAFYPSLSLSGSAGWTNNIGVIVNPATMLYSAIGSLSQPLFNRGVNRANLKIAKAQYEQSLRSFEKALLVAGNEVNGALIECETSSAKSVLRAKQVAANQAAYENSAEMMLHSSTTYLEVLIAQSSLLQSQLVEVSDWFEGMRGRINLYKALGGGVQ